MFCLNFKFMTFNIYFFLVTFCVPLMSKGLPPKKSCPWQFRTILSQTYRNRSTNAFSAAPVVYNFICLNLLTSYCSRKNCLCCEKCEKCTSHVQKVAEIEGTGLLIYRHNSNAKVILKHFVK